MLLIKCHFHYDRIDSESICLCSWLKLKLNATQVSGRRRVGLLQDPRRICVGITRAQQMLVVVTNSAKIPRTSLWHTLIDDAKARGLFHTVHKFPISA